MVEHAIKRDRALVAHPRFADNRASDADYDLDEAIGLATALGVDPISARIVPIRDIRSSNFFGAGQIDDMAAAIAGEELSLLIVNASLTPVQQRNLERILKAGSDMDSFGTPARRYGGARRSRRNPDRK